MAADEELPWTTTRCNRLLRPLSTKLAKLRKELERPRSPNGEGRTWSTAFATKGSPHKTTNFTRPTHKPRGFDKATDPDWRPGLKPAAGKRTYSGRGTKRLGPKQSNSDSNHISRPGEIAFTPLVTRIGVQHSSPLAHQSPLKRVGKNRGPLHVEIDRFQIQGELQKLVQSLLEAFANILQATAAGHERSWKGTRSLMGACLRKIPAYIELEEHFARLDMEADEEEEDRDVAAEIYVHLETQFEQCAGNGWKSFRQVVRAHATNSLCDAVAEGILDLKSLAILVAHCLNVSAWDEAERLVLSYLPLLEAVSMPPNLKADLFDPQKSTYLATVKAFVDRTSRHRLLYDVLEYHIAHELLPLEWLATESMRPIWDRLARGASENDRRLIAHVLQFFETVTLAGMGLPSEKLLENPETGGSRRFAPSTRTELRDALSTTYSSLLTVLCSIALGNNSRKDEAGQAIARSVAWMLKSSTLTISTCANISAEMRLLVADQEDVQTFAQRAISTVFASILVNVGGFKSHSSIISISTLDLFSCIDHLAQAYPLTGITIASILGNIPSQISSTARGAGRIWRDDGFDQLQRLAQALLSLRGCRLPHKLWTTKRLALESSMEFAHFTNSAQHLAFARDVEKQLHTQGKLVIMSSPTKNDSPSGSGGFRWEEGIGEWIACTPFIRQGAKRVSQKPIPVFALLPTPSPSDDNGTGEDSDLDGLVDATDWEVTEPIFEDDEDALTHSSPIKQSKRLSTSSLGKRNRVASPMVLVKSKRTRLTPPGSPIIFYAELPEERHSDHASQRSRRSRKEIRSVSAQLRTQRSRSTLVGGLRNQSRKVYTEHQPQEDNSSSEAPSETEEEMEVKDDMASSMVLSTLFSPQPERAAPQLANYDSEKLTESSDNGDEADDLGITPARPRPRRATTKRLVNRSQSNKEWWKIKKAVIHDSDAESADELSFH